MPSSSSVKRKMPAAGLLQRRVRPRFEPEPESDMESDDDDDVSEEEAAGSFGSDDGDDGPSEEDAGSEGDGDDSEVGSDLDGEEDSDGQDDEAPHIDASQISFGALAKAQSTMGPSSKKRRGHDNSGDESEEEEEDDKKDDGYGHPTNLTSTKRPEKRSNKHAPVELTSKKPVSRKRDFLTTSTAETKRAAARDPRFMPLGGPRAAAGAGAAAGSGGDKIEEIKARKAYAFLDDYRASEMQELRMTIKKTKDPRQRARLEKELMVMESRQRAQARKDREQAVLEAHRKQEKELVKQGKTPFYLKRAEQKKRVLVEQFQGLKKGQVDKAIERRRKKVAGREKKMLPMVRRGAEDR
ncbi:uncharacterized protein C8A04DRAFT_24008 [Dichotomopilus funicola]|uniref:rRNA biogenesis protein RRP36 n=1 Tax=Dichotomopilus funicola TaxID=1934379 RepID=A0AAN6ZSA6_9PEZI|nr:hypothetical protein C8A04DRAFT_24008 [Dichotomopilus funicola]